MGQVLVLIRISLSNRAVGNNTVVYDSNANRLAVFYRDDASPLNEKRMFLI